MTVFLPVQLILLDENNQPFTSNQEISATPVGTAQPLAGVTNVFYVNGLANFTDLAFMNVASNIRLRFRCESCTDAGGAKLPIEETSNEFSIRPAVDHLGFKSPNPSVSAYNHPNVAGVVS
jgi:hypothetical protein